jgi:hypothetical protein
MPLDYSACKRYGDCIVVANNAVTKKQKVTRKRKGVAFTEAVAPRPTTRTEFERRARSLSFSDAFIVVQWLNAAKGSAAYRKVLTVKLELDELGALLDSVRRQKQESRAANKGRQAPLSQEDVTAAVQRAEFYTQFRERHNSLNRTLAKYSFVPVMACDPDMGIWRCSSVPKVTRGRTIEVSDGALTVHVNEAAVVAALARLAANRELYKVRLCEQCQERWRVSERAMDRFCSPECRQEWYAKSPDYGKRRRDIQRRYRTNVKQAIAAHDAALKGRK